MCTGYYAKVIEVSEQVLYIYTFRNDSLAGDFCSKPNELKTRAAVSFRVEKLFKQWNVGIEQQDSFKSYLLKMLGQDRALFRYYFYKLTEIYPSMHDAISDLCKGKGARFKVKLYLYSCWLRMTRWL